MAFGINRLELNLWKAAVSRGETAYLTHYWFDPRFPSCNSVTKVGNANLERLTEWCIANDLNPKYIHNRPPYPHFDLIGPKQIEILRKESLIHHLVRFKLE